MGSEHDLKIKEGIEFYLNFGKLDWNLSKKMVKTHRIAILMGNILIKPLFCGHPSFRQIQMGS
jgi:hypothetical protein